MRLVVLVAIIFLLLPSVSAQTHTLEVVPDHDPWASADVDRFAVRMGNCMTWTVRAFNGSEPAAEVAVLVTDSQGRESTVYTGTSGMVEVGTTQCWTTARVVDHAFEVTGTLDGQVASSDRVVHEVMWSAGQVYADVPDVNGQVSIPVRAVWTATNEPMPVSRAVAVHNGQTFDIPLENGSGTLAITRGSGTLEIGVPASAWLPGGPGATISVTAAGPFWSEQQNAPPPSGGGSPPPAETPPRQETGSDAPSGGSGSGQASNSPDEPAASDTVAPAANDTVQPDLPTDSAEDGASGTSSTTRSPADDDASSEGIPAFGIPLLAAALILARRRA